VPSLGRAFSYWRGAPVHQVQRLTEPTVLPTHYEAAEWQLKDVRADALLSIYPLRCLSLHSSYRSPTQTGYDETWCRVSATISQKPNSTPGAEADRNNGAPHALRSGDSLLSIYPLRCLSIHPSIHPSIPPSIHPSIHPITPQLHTLRQVQRLTETTVLRTHYEAAENQLVQLHWRCLSVYAHHDS